MQCQVCQKTVSPGLYALRIECKHWVHTRCLSKFPENFQKCPGCLGLVDANVPRYVEEEPDSHNGRDFVQQPLSDSYFNSFSVALSAKKEPFKWIAEKVPLDWIRDDKGYGLQRLIASGVKFEHFLNAGYTWEDLKVFRDFGDPTRIDRARKALFALKCNAEHLRDYPHLLGNMVQQLEINGRHLCELYGLGFAPNKCEPLCVYGGTNKVPWKATDLIKFGIKMYDLHAYGLSYLEQYQHLQPTDVDEIAMEVKDEDVMGLPSLVEMAAAAAAAAAARPAPVQPAPPPEPRAMYIPPVVVKYETNGIKLHGLKTRK